MNETNYPGIDYSGPGSTANRDPETGIRYGIISQSSLIPEAADDISTKGTDLGYEHAEQELKDKLRGVLVDYFSDHKWTDEQESRLTRAVRDAFDALDGWSDGMEFNGPWQLEENGLAVRLDSDGDVWVFKSPFYTYAQFCSPCAPGACHLNNPLELPLIPRNEPPTHHTQYPSNKCYCLPHDWFEGGKAPYRMWRVDNNEEVMP